MPRGKKAVATSSFSIDSVQYTSREVPSKERYSPYREIAAKLAEKGVGACAEKLPDQNTASRIAGYLRAADLKTRVSEVEGAGWCVWNKGKKGK
jgi:hypothetical protein